MIFGCAFFLSGFLQRAASVKTNSLVNVIHICIRVGRFRELLIQIHSNLLQIYFPPNIMDGKLRHVLNIISV